MVERTESFFRLDSLDIEAANEVIDETQAQTGQGGSQFEPVDPTPRPGLTKAVVTVLFRPFPFEVSNGVGIISAFEGLVLLGLTVSAFPRLGRLPRRGTSGIPTCSSPVATARRLLLRRSWA